MKDIQDKEDYKNVLKFCKEDLRYSLQSAIWSGSISTEFAPGTDNRDAAGEQATWGAAAGANHTIS
jgi:hypothetical protein